MFSELKVLITDDAPVVISSVKATLRQLGFSEENVFFARSPKACIYMASQNTFDIYICNYNFGLGLNGKQVLEELAHRSVLTEESIFILISGESSRRIAQSIIELRPDEYILKPFNPRMLKKRIVSASIRKKELTRIYSAELNREFESGLLACEELEMEKPQYYDLIQKFKGEFYRKLERYKEAQTVYQSILSHKPYQWAALGLANTMVAQDNNAQAISVLNKLSSAGTESSELQVELGNYYLSENNPRQAIFHFKLAQDLAPGNPEREMIISNLYITIGDHRSALERFRAYARINTDTFRDTPYTKANLIRRILLSASLGEDTGYVDKCIKEAKQLVAQLCSSSADVESELESQLIVIDAHIDLLENNINAAISKLKYAYKSGLNTHFYDWLHICWLLKILSLDDRLDKTIPRLRTLLGEDNNPYIQNSKVKLLESLKLEIEKRNEWLDEHYLKAKRFESDRNIQGLLTTYLKIRDQQPYLREALVKIMKLLTYEWPEGMPFTQIEDLIFNCDSIVRQLLNSNQLEAINYQATYSELVKRVLHQST